MRRSGANEEDVGVIGRPRIIERQSKGEKEEDGEEQYYLS